MSDNILAFDQRFKRFGLTVKDIEEAIRSACDFFRIPMPRMIQDMTNVHNGQTMLVNWNRMSYEDDVLCFNMQQNTQFPGINNGIWEHELAADFLMGCRAGLWNMDDSKITVGLILTDGSPTHPEGVIRALFIRQGKYKAIEMRNKSIPLSVQNLLNEFMAYRQENLKLIHRYQRKFYRF